MNDGSGTAFTISQQPVSPVISNSATSLAIVFNPMSGGIFTDTVTIANNDPDENPYTFVVSGTALYVLDMITVGNGIVALDPPGGVTLKIHLSPSPLRPMPAGNLNPGLIKRALSQLPIRFT
jgi:hypothetical protein